MTSFKLEGRSVASVLMQVANDWVGRTQRDLRTKCEPVSVRIHPADLAEPFPEIATLSEIAEMLGVTRQRAQQMSKETDFPHPVARTKSGPVYAVQEIEPIVVARQRNTGRDTAGEVTRLRQPTGHKSR